MPQLGGSEYFCLTQKNRFEVKAAYRQKYTSGECCRKYNSGFQVTGSASRMWCTSTAVDYDVDYSML